MAGQNWTNVDIRVPRPGQGEPVVIEVNPMPAIFLPPTYDWEDHTIRESFPGGHPALINTLIASHMLWRRPCETTKAVGEEFDNFSSTYDEAVEPVYQHFRIFSSVISRINYSKGTILELGSGTGLFGRALVQKMQQITPPESESESSSESGDEAPLSLGPKKKTPQDRSFDLTGIELSKGMADVSQKTGAYRKVHIGTVQSIIPTIGPFDHIVAFSMLYFLTPEDFTMTMVRAFQLARKSLVVSIDKIPDAYNEKLIKSGPPASNMVGHNHLSIMEKMFCNPPPNGWKLANKQQHWGWKSPSMDIEVYLTVYIFERQT
ncbi:hypothetical protein TWF730_006641 [Orbilia blumenaviensis]|uniref:Methyltransferase domain-containing protein n=1 Tax=Orbilia blumenaviensis TaxID=1796055 RepID=A0AAV9VHU6_9PEZI